MVTEAEAVGQTSTSRSRAKRNRASTLSAAPPDAFQIILKGLMASERFKISILKG